MHFEENMPHAHTLVTHAVHLLEGMGDATYSCFTPIPSTRPVPGSPTTRLYVHMNITVVISIPLRMKRSYNP